MVSRRTNERIGESKILAGDFGRSQKRHPELTKELKIQNSGTQFVTSVSSLAPLNLRRSVSRRVSCYALFQGWLLLSQPPRCIRNATTFSTELEFRDLS